MMSTVILNMRFQNLLLAGLINPETLCVAGSQQQILQMQPWQMKSVYTTHTPLF